MTNNGIRSLSERIKRLEMSNIETAPENRNGFEDNVLKKMKQRKEEKQLTELNNIKMHFCDDLIESVQEVTNKTKVVEFTIRYIEMNIHKIAKLLEHGITGELKLNIAKMFIEDIFMIADIDLENMINHLHSLIFPKPALELNDREDTDLNRHQTVSEKKKHKFTLFKN